MGPGRLKNMSFAHPTIWEIATKDILKEWVVRVILIIKVLFNLFKAD